MIWFKTLGKLPKSVKDLFGIPDKVKLVLVVALTTPSRQKDYVSEVELSLTEFPLYVHAVTVAHIIKKTLLSIIPLASYTAFRHPRCFIIDCPTLYGCNNNMIIIPQI